MEIYSAVVLLLVGVCALAQAYLKLPSYISPCSINLPELGECEKINGNAAISELVKGDVTYSIPVLDPLLVNEMRLGDAHSYISLANITIEGLRNTEIVNRHHDALYRRVYTELSVPLLIWSSDYDMNFKFLNVAIVGRGRNNVTLENFKLDSVLDYDLHRKQNGKLHMVFRNIQATFDITGGQMYLDDAFTRDKIIAARVNQFLNENFHEAFQVVAPGIGQILSKLLLEVYFGLTDLVPFDEFYSV